MSTALQQRDRLAGILGRIQTQMGEVLPRHLDPETMTRIVLVEGARNPKIGRCTAESIGPNGDRVLRCGYVIGYRGYLELARRAGLRMNAGVVYADEIERGSFSWTVEPPAIDHAGALGVRRTDDALVLAYAVAVDRDGHRYQLVMDRQGIDEARGASGGGKVWREHFASMARKTAIRRLLAGGLVPLSTELATAIDEERRAEVVEAVEVTPPPAAHPDADPLRMALGIEDKADQVAEAEA
jgi:recombination protein RecT